mgnify:CR=1 FL=1
MFKVNDNYLKLPGSYLFSTIGKKVRAYQAANPDKEIIRLGIGDVTQPLAPAIIDRLHEAVSEMGVQETFKGYAPDLGYEFLRSAIVKNDYNARGVDIAIDEVFVSDGAKCDSGNIQEIFSLDNKIAVCDPVYPVYVDSNVMAGRTGTYDATTGLWSDVIYMPCKEENGFAPELPEETPDIIYLCFPNNPTGAVMEKSDLEKIAAVIEKYDLFVLSDEIYSELTYLEKHVSIASLPGMWERTIVINGMSKSHAMTGWRLGYACGPRVVVEQMLKIHQFAIMCAPTTSQYAGVEALKNGDADVAQMREEYNGRRRYLLHRFEEMGLQCFEPFGAFYVFPYVGEFGMTSEEFATGLLNDQKLAVVPGTAFGKCGEGFVRISYAYSLDNLREAMNRMEAYVTKLRQQA